MTTRYQNGTLVRSKRKSGDVWLYRFRETVGSRRVQRTKVVGTVKRFPTEAAARRSIELIRVNLNAATPTSGPVMRFNVLADHYCAHEMPLDNHEAKANSTKVTNYGYLRKWIAPKWGEAFISEVTPVAVESWLKTLLPLADGSKAKIRNLMSAIYRHAMRHGFIQHNPIQLVRQGSKRKKAPEILTVEEMSRLLGALRLRERTMVLLDAGSGLRRGELFGLMWADIEFQAQQVSVRRSIVGQVAGKVKTEVSERMMPLDDSMTAALLDWFAFTPYRAPDDYVFASDANRAGEKRGKQPLWPAKVMTYWIQPAAKSLGIAKHIGWHTFRHTFSNLLRANGEDVKTVQELLRHASARMTMDVYSQAVSEDKRRAQADVVRMFAAKGTA